MPSLIAFNPESVTSTATYGSEQWQSKVRKRAEGRSTTTINQCQTDIGPGKSQLYRQLSDSLFDPPARVLTRAVLNKASTVKNGLV
jgi:hypothetical protein